MCPAAPPTDIGVYSSEQEAGISFESPIAGIGVYSSDEEVVMSLERIVRGCPLPANVITEVNPYIVSPWNLPDGIWYFFNLGDPKATETGYWMPTGENHRIITYSSTTGSRSTLEFYLGQAPDGIKTDWVMHDYRINRKELREIDKAEDSRSLSRVFLNYGQASNTEEQQRNKAKGMSVNLNIEKNNSKFSSSKPEVKKDDDSEPLADPSYNNPFRDRRELCDISKGDFLELLDLDNSESSSSSSVNSRRLSFSSDEYFDPVAILRALDSGIGHDPEQKFTDGKLSVSAPTRLVQVVLRPESLGNDRCSSRVGENLVQNALLHPVEANKGVEDEKHVPCKKKVGDMSLNPSTSKQERLPSSNVHTAAMLADVESKAGTSRMRKLKKKYWCFNSF